MGIMTKLNQFLIYDELPLWSAPFGLMLLDTVRLGKNIRILDIGSGSGFPMLEIAERSGESCRVYGIDPSDDAVFLVTEKIRIKGITNAEILPVKAEILPFDDSTFGLIVSNNGLNNAEDPVKVLGECYRTAIPGGQLVFTMNLPHTFSAFYDMLEDTLAELGLHEVIQRMYDHIRLKRKPVEWWQERILESGLQIVSIQVDGFKFRFTDGQSFLKHYFIRTAFMPPWRSFLPESRADEILSVTEQKLDALAKESGMLEMQVPFACFDCMK
jgi:ubiquinone/menaquinone biosynthesis C-methylase UbiE